MSVLQGCYCNVGKATTKYLVVGASLVCIVDVILKVNVCLRV